MPLFTGYPVSLFQPEYFYSYDGSLLPVRFKCLKGGVTYPPRRRFVAGRKRLTYQASLVHCGNTDSSPEYCPLRVLFGVSGWRFHVPSWIFAATAVSDKINAEVPLSRRPTASISTERQEQVLLLRVKASPNGIHSSDLSPTLSLFSELSHVTFTSERPIQPAPSRT